MKFFVGLLVATLCLHAVLALPAGSPSDDAEVINVPQRGVASAGSSAGGSAADPFFNNFDGVIDTNSGYPFLQPDPQVFSLNFGFFDSFDDIFRRLRNRLWSVAPTDGDSSEETGIGFGLNSKNGNTTSTVKIVDGHKVEVNETTYGDDNSVFKVRVVNIRPLESGEDVEEGTITKTNTDNNENENKNGNNPVTSAPSKQPANEDDSDERREPLEKHSDENEIHSNIDEVKY